MCLVAAVTIALCMHTLAAAPRSKRLTLAEPMPSYYNTGLGGAYSFGYDFFDPATGNTQFRSEERYQNGTVAGSYGYVDPLGKTRTYKYVADQRGYRVVSEKNTEVINSSANLQYKITTTEPTISWTRPSKKKPQERKKDNVFQKRKFNNVQSPGYYILY